MPDVLLGDTDFIKLNVISKINVSTLGKKII